MSRRKPSVIEKRLVWRIDARHPLGAFVDPAEDHRPPPRPEPADPSTVSSGWMLSSYDLREGTVITEGGDTVPDDLFDELFPAVQLPSPCPPEAA